MGIKITEGDGTGARVYNLDGKHFNMDINKWAIFRKMDNTFCGTIPEFHSKFGTVCSAGGTLTEEWESFFKDLYAYHRSNNKGSLEWQQ